MTKVMLGLVMILPLTVRWWVSVEGREEYMLRNTLNHHHDRVCGSVQYDPDARAWSYYTLRTGGAHEGLSGTASTEDEAKAAVAGDCGAARTAEVLEVEKR